MDYVGGSDVISRVLKSRKRNQKRELKRYDNGVESENCNLLALEMGGKEAISQDM